MQILKYIGRRMLLVVPQIIGIVFVSFMLVKTIPGDPAVLMLGPTATPDAIASLRESMGLDKPLPVQFGLYLKNLVKGDMGTSWQTTRPVLEDLVTRFPATLELVTAGLLVAILIGLPLGLISAFRPRSWLSKVADFYSLIAGSLPDFWLALVLIYVFYALLGVAPAPLGRIDLAIMPPPHVTGMYTVDSLIAMDWEAFKSSVSHLVLPVLALGLVNAGPIFKMTQSTVERMLHSDFSRFEVLCGMPHRLVVAHALRNAAPSILTIVSVLYGFLIGGAVLIEIVFSWGGAGQYAVQGVLNADLYPVLGFVLFSAVFSLFVYLIVDLLYFAVDPRLAH